ncbi:MAG: pyruvate kinase [Miltoncostaeaceae bacterium]
MDAPQPGSRRTKILATIGPACADPGVLRRLVAAGMDGARINLSHGNAEQWLAQAREIRAIEEECGHPITVLCDLQGPKIRLAPDTPMRRVGLDDEVLVVSGMSTPEGTLAVAWDDVVEAALPGVSELVIGDGTPRLDIIGETVHGGVPALVARCTKPGDVAPRRGATITHVSHSAPSLTSKDRADLDVLRELRPDVVALSFVRAAGDIDALRGELAGRDLAEVRIVAKIEKSEAMRALDGIVAASDGIMVARGDLGIELGVAELPLAQKRIIRRAAGAGKMVITATQMLESMHLRPEPTRAEATDVANAIIDGTSAVMLSGETAQGSYPVEAVSAMDEIARVAERAITPSSPPDDILSDAEAVLKAAALLGESREVACYITPTQTGGSPRALARNRPRAPIVALCHDGNTARQLALEWGVVARGFPEHRSVPAMLEAAMEYVTGLMGLPPGAAVVMAYGPAVATPGGTSFIVLRHVPLPQEQPAEG